MRHRQAGVTLLELMVVVAVLMVATAIAIPVYRDYVRTAEQGAMQQKIDSLRIFQQSYFIDNGTYFAGTYQSGGVNPFEAIGFRVPADNDGITLEVMPCGAQPLTACYRVEARMEGSRHAVVWQDGKFSGYEMP